MPTNIAPHSHIHKTILLDINRCHVMSRNTSPKTCPFYFYKNHAGNYCSCRDPDSNIGLTCGDEEPNEDEVEELGFGVYKTDENGDLLVIVTFVLPNKLICLDFRSIYRPHHFYFIHVDEHSKWLHSKVV